VKVAEELSRLGVEDTGGGLLIFMVDLEEPFLSLRIMKGIESFGGSEADFGGVILLQAILQSWDAGGGFEIAESVDSGDANLHLLVIEELLDALTQDLVGADETGGLNGLNPDGEVIGFETITQGGSGLIDLGLLCGSAYGHRRKKQGAKGKSCSHHDGNLWD
jgi:hypothetical protein